ncbi:Proline-rich receptor-like protein kinase [Nymphaea thermarum]|nr:Proline-rich receptor-like protein kinase [Nymphaea thermarum]
MVAAIFSTTASQGGQEMKGSSRNLLVGIRLDGEGHELLSWAIFKVAEPGDSIIVLHVFKDSGLSTKNKMSTLCLTKSLDSFLASYDSFCTMRKVSLVGRLCRGKSIRNVLVQEAKECAAISVVLGVCRTSLGLSVSMAKYCAKRLPSHTSVMAVHNGKIMFLSNESKKKAGIVRSEVVSKPSASKTLASLFEDSKTDDPNCPQDLESNDGEVIENMCFSQSTESRSTSSGITVGASPVNFNFSLQLDDSESGDFSTSRSSRSGSEALSSNRNSKSDLLEDGRSDSFMCESQRETESIDIEDAHEEAMEEAPGLVTLLVRKFPEHPGWPLLRKATVLGMEGLHSPEARKMPVVQWALQLPNRSPLGSPWHSHSLEKADANERDQRTDLSRELAVLHKRNSSSWRRFSNNEFQSLSMQFSSGNLVGKGGCSKVYKVLLPHGKPLAVKILKTSEEAWKEFLLEVEIISSLEHKNIISLVGVCVEDNSLISVYNFLPRGSLEYYLHGRKGKTPLPWKLRFKIAVGVAEALNYLHNGCSRPVIHRDVKSSNILLSNDFEPQLSDFGLAIWAPTTSSEITHYDVFGTFGYLAPEYFMYGKMSDKIDVYSFGVVLLELLSGRKPISNDNPKGQESLVMWAAAILEEGNPVELIDPSLAGKYDEDQIRRMMMAASLCIRRTVHRRPQINLILKLLKGDGDAINWARQQLSNSKEPKNQDEEACLPPDIRCHLGVALNDVEEDALSVCSIEQNNDQFIETYLQGRCSRSSSFE